MCSCIFVQVFSLRLIDCCLVTKGRGLALAQAMTSQQVPGDCGCYCSLCFLLTFHPKPFVVFSRPLHGPFLQGTEHGFGKSPLMRAQNNCAVQWKPSWWAKVTTQYPGSCVPALVVSSGRRSDLCVPHQPHLMTSPFLPGWLGDSRKTKSPAEKDCSPPTLVTNLRIIVSRHEPPPRIEACG